MAGAFNANIIKRVHSLIKNDYQGHMITVLPVGKKVHDAFRKTEYLVNGMDIPQNANHLFDKLSFESASPVIEQVMEAYKNNQFDKVLLVYNQFKNAAVQITTEEQMLPIEQTKSDNSTATKTKENYIFSQAKKKSYFISSL